MKMVLQAQRGRGRPERTRLLTVRGGYHGDTFGAMTVCDPVAACTRCSATSCPQHVFADRPPAAGDAAAVARVVASFRGLAAAPRATSWPRSWSSRWCRAPAACTFYDAACVRRAARAVPTSTALLLVLDEIATGFGRTGTLFAAEHAGVVARRLCVGQGADRRLPDAGRGAVHRRGRPRVSASESGVLMHGPTFMANPLACAVALASLDLLATGAWRDDVARIGAGLARGLAGCRELPGVADVRVLGAVGVVELDDPVDIGGDAAALDAGVWLRPFRDLVYTMPPYVCTDDDVARICAGVAAAAAVA